MKPTEVTVWSCMCSLKYRKKGANVGEEGAWGRRRRTTDTKVGRKRRTPPRHTRVRAHARTDPHCRQSHPPPPPPPHHTPQPQPTASPHGPSTQHAHKHTRILDKRAQGACTIIHARIHAAPPHHPFALRTLQYRGNLAPSPERAPSRSLGSRAPDQRNAEFATLGAFYDLGARLYWPTACSGTSLQCCRHM